MESEMESSISKDQIISLIRIEKELLKEKFGVVNIGLFGSYAKDQQTPDSDIDLLVEFKEPRFDWIANLQDYMETKFKKRVEIVRKRNSAGSRFFYRVEQEVIYA
jgi:predicted nucleotidyltransferase